jgi:hypothetical protein
LSENQKSGSKFGGGGYLSDDSPSGPMASNRRAKFMTIFKNISFEEALSQYHLNELGDTLLSVFNRTVVLDDDDSKELHFRYTFPKMFYLKIAHGSSMDSVIFLLKVVVCYHIEHYYTYVPGAFSSVF